MDRVVENLWLGDMYCITDVEDLKENNIQSILSVMRGTVVVQDTFVHKQIEIDDDEGEDILNHLIAAISFLESELEKGHGVLVHCQAGISRSPTIVAAYLMYSRQLNTVAALALIRQSRPDVDPNSGFLQQLDVFHRASYKVSRNDKSTRMYYLERAVQEMLNGDGSKLDTEMFARFPSGPSDSKPLIPAPVPHHRIRCKTCRQELAAREHMLDHGQLGPPTPTSVGAFTPVDPCRLSVSDAKPRGPSMPDQSGGEEGRGIEGEKKPDLLSVDGFAYPNNLSTQLHANQNSAALQTTGLHQNTTPSLALASAPPILADQRCSGYFVEAVKWMEPFLENGEMSGKIICPNKKCGAKLGNYDWAGVRCSCKAWVVPGFCIHRSKVDEIVVLNR